MGQHKFDDGIDRAAVLERLSPGQYDEKPCCVSRRQAWSGHGVVDKQLQRGHIQSRGHMVAVDRAHTNALLLAAQLARM